MVNEEKENKINQGPNLQSKADERRRQLEEYLESKKKKKLSTTTRSGAANTKQRAASKIAAEKILKGGKEAQLAKADPPLGRETSVASIQDNITITTPEHEIPSGKESPRLFTNVASVQSIHKSDLSQLVIHDQSVVQTITAIAELSPRGPPVSIKIDWNMPVYLNVVGSKRLLPIRSPPLRFFRPSQIKRVLSEERWSLAEVMILVLKASREFSRCRILQNLVSSWEGRLAVVSNASPTQSITPNSKRCASTSFAESPKTPEFQIEDGLDAKLYTPGDDSDTLKLQEEVDEVVRRTPAIQKLTPPSRTDLIRKASTAIKSANMSLFDASSTGKNAQSGKNTQSAKLSNRDFSYNDNGSAYLYTLVTPTKRMREMLETDAAISPVRRSKRIMEKGHSPAGTLFNTLDEVPDLARNGFLPNSAINADILCKKRDPLPNCPGNESLLDSPSRSTKRSKLD